MDTVTFQGRQQKSSASSYAIKPSAMQKFIDCCAASAVLITNCWREERTWRYCSRGCITSVYRIDLHVFQKNYFAKFSVR